MGLWAQICTTAILREFPQLSTAFQQQAVSAMLPSSEAIVVIEHAVSVLSELPNLCRPDNQYDAHLSDIAHISEIARHAICPCPTCWAY